jgi:hypothetical protein
MADRHLFAFKVSKLTQTKVTSAAMNESPENWSPVEYDAHAQLWQGRGLQGATADGSLYCTSHQWPDGRWGIAGGNWWWQSDDPNFEGCNGFPGW